MTGEDQPAMDERIKGGDQIMKILDAHRRVRRETVPFGGEPELLRLRLQVLFRKKSDYLLMSCKNFQNFCIDFSFFIKFIDIMIQ